MTVKLCDMYPMFSKPSRSLQKIRRQLEIFTQKEDDEIEVAKAEKQPHDVIESLRSDWRFARQELWDEEAAIYSTLWCKKARKMRIPPPSRSDERYWYDSNWVGRILTDEGVQQIRKAWKEEWQWRITICSAIFGFIFGLGGLAVAILAIIH